MTLEEQSLSLVLRQEDESEQSVFIDPLAERQRLCFENIPANQAVLTLLFRRAAGIWRDGFIHLYRIQLSDQGSETGKDTLHFADPDEILEACTLTDLRYRHSALGEVFVITGPNPSVTISLPETKSDSSQHLCIELSAPYSLDFAIAQDGFIREENDYISQIRDLEFELLSHKKYKAEIEEIKRSKAWKMIEGGRQLVYNQLLGRLPSLRDRALDVTRPEESKKASEMMGAAWKYEYTFTEADANRIKSDLIKLKKKPLISLVMPVFNVNPEWLQAAIESVEKQLYENWELCIVDDASTREETIAYLKTLRHPRIRTRFLDNNRNISGATNEAIRFANGEYLAFMDNDDELTADALYEMVKAINETDADLIYSDEDFIDLEGKYSDPHFKPDYSPDLLLSHNYITHFVVAKKSLVEEAGLLNSRFDGAQDHELLL